MKQTCLDINRFCKPPFCWWFKRQQESKLCLSSLCFPFCCYSSLSHLPFLVPRLGLCSLVLHLPNWVGASSWDSESVTLPLRKEERSGLLRTFLPLPRLRPKQQLVLIPLPCVLFCGKVWLEGESGFAGGPTNATLHWLIEEGWEKNAPESENAAGTGNPALRELSREECWRHSQKVSLPVIVVLDERGSCFKQFGVQMQI